MTPTSTSVWRLPFRKSSQTWAKDTQNWGFRPSNLSSCHHWKSTTAKDPASRSVSTWSWRTSRSTVWPVPWSTTWRLTWTTTSWAVRSDSPSPSRSPDNTRSTERCLCCQSLAQELVTLSCVSVVLNVYRNFAFGRFSFVVFFYFHDFFFYSRTRVGLERSCRHSVPEER